MDIRLREIIKETLKPYENEIKALKELKQYAQHLGSCSFTINFNKGPCTCGLNELLKGES